MHTILFLDDIPFNSVKGLLYCIFITYNTLSSVHDLILGLFHCIVLTSPATPGHGYNMLHVYNYGRISYLKCILFVVSVCYHCL